MCIPSATKTSDDDINRAEASAVEVTPNGITTATLDRIFTLKELASSYNTPQNAYASVHGTVLNISSFAKHHPGGDLILLSAGRDATILFETYHPRLQHGIPKAIVEKYAVGRLSDGGVRESYYDWCSTFYPTLKGRVCERLRTLRLSRRGGYEIFIKACCLLVGFWFSLVQMITRPFPQACLWSCLMGIFASFVGTCIQHDGNHGAFSSYKFLNKLAGWTLDMIGASAYTWYVAKGTMHINLFKTFIICILIRSMNAFSCFLFFLQGVPTYVRASPLHEFVT